MIELAKDVEATTIPYGHKTRLPKGSKVEITQELGGSFTVMCDYGLLRIEGKDADALGRTEAAGAVEQPVDIPKDAKEMAGHVWSQLKTCYDPEIPVNIVELGLVYENKVEPVPDGGGYRVDIKFTLTAPGCGMGGILQAEAREKILGLPGIKECAVEIVFDPPWTQSMMSEAARLQLGLL